TRDGLRKEPGDSIDPGGDPEATTRRTPIGLRCPTGLRTTVWPRQTVQAGHTQDRYRVSSEAISRVMGQIEELYVKVIYLLCQSHPQECETLADELWEVFGAMGRIKIGLLPKSPPPPEKEDAGC